MAITQTYVDYGTGNDYNGASFTDGAFTVADMTLTKTGAFTKSKANHWLYLTDNGSGQVTAGYYKVASVTSVNAVVLATSPKSGATDPTDVKCTQATGTTLLPFRSVQGALDIITRNATDGDQINVKAGTNQVNQAALTLTTYGAPAQAGPLILRGYTTAANDGGIGTIDCGGAVLFAASTNSYIALIDLQIHTFGDNNGISLAAGCLIAHCQIHKGASSPSGKSLLTCGNSSIVLNNYFYNTGTNGTAINHTGNAGFVYGNFVSALGTGILVSSVIVVGNVVAVAATGATGIYAYSNNCVIAQNTVYNSTAGTGAGIRIDAVLIGLTIFNNVIEGFSGAGGKGINFTAASNTGDAVVFGYNAFYNNTTPISTPGIYWDDLTAHDVTLLASPFTNAAGADFSVSTALKALGFPASFLGSSTNDYVDIGAAQRQEPAGGAVSISPSLGSVGAA